MLVKSLLICFLSFILIYDPAIAIESFKESYELIINILLPSMLPFMIISQLVVLTDIKNIAALLMKAVFRIFNLPSDLAAFFICSIIGGYPTGIKSLSASLRNNSISEDTVKEYIPFLINAGPGFVVVAVGKVMFGSLKLGVILYISQITASLVIGKLLMKKEKYVVTNSKKGMRFSQALVISVNDSSEAMLTISGYILFFSLITSVLEGIFGDFLPSRLLSSIMEVTNGCKIASGMSKGYLLASFLISFSGLSSIYQIKSIAYKDKLNLEKIIPIKLFEGILASAITFLLVKLFPITQMAASINTPPLCTYSPNRLMEIILIGMMFSQIFVSTDFSGA